MPEGWVLLSYQFGPPLLRAVFVVVATLLAVRVIRSSFDYATRRTGADASVRLLVGRAVSIVILGIGVATFLDTVGVPLTTFVTVLGVAGLGISLAMQDILKSFVAGTYLLFERPFRIGDEISVKDQRGVVEHIGIRTTLLRNADNVQIIIPNGVVFAELVANRTNERKPDPEPVDASSDDGPSVDGLSAPAAATTTPPPPASASATAPALSPAPTEPAPAASEARR
jgi:small-conductance mechanosensitive channel